MKEIIWRFRFARQIFRNCRGHKIPLIESIKLAKWEFGATDYYPDHNPQWSADEEMTYWDGAITTSTTDNEPAETARTAAQAATAKQRIE